MDRLPKARDNWTRVKSRVFQKPPTPVGGVSLDSLERDGEGVKEGVRIYRSQRSSQGDQPRRNPRLLQHQRTAGEGLGFRDIGKGSQDVDAGAFAFNGSLPVNPNGGLKSIGHPVGASGVSNI
ncbi:MAG: hypothetical protein PHV74_01750 [Dehalococcoidia bacterium]|nr:hypothetical protein [Dehalococcoidia bacterium]